MSDPKRGDRLLMCATVGLLALALIFALVAISPVIYFDADPRSEATDLPYISLGPTGVMVWNLLAVGWSALALAAHATAGGRMRWGSAALIGVGCAACALHFHEHVDSLWRGAHWFAAACLALAALHLAEHEQPRRFMAAAFIALLAPLLIAALRYIWVDHPETVQQYLKYREEILRAQGWALNSPQHLLFERRMQFNDVAGAFALSNVYGSIVAALTAFAAALAVSQLRRRQWERAAVLAGVVVAGAACVYMSKSKGAAAGCVMALGVIVLAHLRWRRWLPGIGVVFVVGAIGVVLVRGWIGPPETAEGERSLLFRWQYWQAAERMIAPANALPQQMLIGVGPGPFRELYLQYKNPLNPEEIISAHNVFVDWITMLGIGGVAWTLLMLGWLWRGGSQLDIGPHPIPLPRGEGAGEIDLRQLGWACALALLLFGTQFLVMREVLLNEQVLMLTWLLGVGLFIVLATMIQNETWTPTPALRLGLFAAAPVLLVHAQIEMTFFHQGSAAIAWCMIAMAAARSDPGTPSTNPARWLFPLLVIVAGIILVPSALSVFRQQQQMAAGAAALKKEGPTAALPYLDRAIAAMPSDPRPYRWQADLRLENAYHAALRHDTEKVRQWTNEALAKLDEAPIRDVALTRSRAQILDRAASLLEEPMRRNEAAEEMEKLLARHPYSLQDRMYAADLYWRMGNRMEARRHYEECLRVNEQTYLDPLKQLTPEKLELIEKRLKASDGNGG